MRYLLPLLGNMNHAGPAAANVRIKQDRSTGAFVVVAKRDIAKGTEVSLLDSEPLQCAFLHPIDSLSSFGLPALQSTLL